MIAQCDGLTHRKLDYWCQQGLFPDVGVHAGRRRREFSEEDLRVSQVLARVSAAFDRWSRGRGGYIGVYREVAEQVRARTAPIRVSFAPGIEIIITVDEPTQSTVDEPVDEEPSEVAFIPGVGVDNA